MTDGIFRRLRTRAAQAALAAFCGVLLLGSSGCSRVFWRPDLGGGMRLAGERNQVVVVAYWSSLNADCMRMEEKVFTNPEVVKTLRGTIPVRISSLTNQRFAEDYGLTTVPAFVIFGPDGGVLRASVLQRLSR